MFALDSDKPKPKPNNNSKEKLSDDNSPEINALDDVLNLKYNEGDEIYSIAQFVRGHVEPLKKKPKTTDMRPVVFVRFNSRRGKVKPITLTALLDSGGSGCLISEEFTKKLKLHETNQRCCH